jgi:hypothetical protein
MTAAPEGRKKETMGVGRNIPEVSPYVPPLASFAPLGLAAGAIL